MTDRNNGYSIGDVHPAAEREPRPPEATKCQNCGTVAAEWICHICKQVKHQPYHAGDACVGIASCFIAIGYCALTALGLA